MSWQKCPLCEGKGYSVIMDRAERVEDIRPDHYYPCTACMGHKIISEVTGLPPSLETVYIMPNAMKQNEYPIPDKVRERLKEFKEKDPYHQST